MAVKLEDKTRVDAPDSDYPYGKIRDKTPSEGGTPVNTEVYGDFHQFFAKMLALSGITANGLPDNAYSGFQYLQALVNVMNSEAGKHLVLSKIGNYSTGNLIILHGCEIVANIPGTSSITSGAIYYNGRIYAVPANASISSPSNTLVFKIDESEQPEFIYLSNAVSGTGIADYNGATVKHYSYIHRNGSAGTSNLINISSVTYAVIQSIIRVGVITDITVTVQAVVTNGASGSSIDIELPSEAFVQDSLYSTPGTFPVSGTVMIENNTTGAIVAVKSIHNGLNATDAYIISNKIRCGLYGGSVGNGQQVEWSVSLRCLSSL